MSSTHTHKKKMKVDLVNEWTAAIASLLASLIAYKPFKAWLLSLVEKVRTRRVVRPHMKNLTYLQNINDWLQTISEIDNVTRALIFAGHDSGEMPNLTSPYYVTQLAKAVVGEHEEKLGNYEKVLASPQYIKMLNKLYEEGEIHFDTEKEDNGQLKNYYIAEEIKHAMIFFLRITNDHNFIYMSVSTVNPDGFSDKDMAEIRRALTYIQTNINLMN